MNAPNTLKQGTNKDQYCCHCLNIKTFAETIFQESVLYYYSGKIVLFPSQNWPTYGNGELANNPHFSFQCTIANLSLHKHLVAKDLRKIDLILMLFYIIQHFKVKILIIHFSSSKDLVVQGLTCSATTLKLIQSFTSSVSTKWHCRHALYIWSGLTQKTSAASALVSKK